MACISVYKRADGETVFSCTCGEMDKGQNIMAAVERHNNIKHEAKAAVHDLREPKLPGYDVLAQRGRDILASRADTVHPFID